ncbi:LuxR family transcriptional regulator [Streptomyces sp. NPDC053069]|uniref:LuxR family transcriptional regulator n=1 Tax=Streptomyces sp. NPDC053069 TaxID=3365695 RepID=UPI0037D1CF2E
MTERGELRVARGGGLLEPEDVEVYVSLLPRLPGPADGAPPEAVRRLVAIGLLHESGEAGEGRHPVTYAAVNPARVGGLRAKGVLDEAQEMIGRLLRDQETLAPAVDAYLRQRDSGGYKVHSGLPHINAAIEIATRECHEEILTSQPGGPRSAEVLATALPPTLDMLRRGARMKTIYQHNARSGPATQAYVRAIEEHGAEVRTLDENFDRLIIFDRKVAFIPGTEDRSVAVEVRIPAVVSFLAVVFERSWLRAVPFTPPGRDRATARITDEMELAILRHVVAGDKDAVTAQQLGISIRRCQAYIARLSDRLGSRSRAQLGYLIAKSGLLEAHVPDEPPEDPEHTSVHAASLSTVG